MKRVLFLAAMVAALTNLPLRAGGLPEKLRVLSVELDNALIETPGAPGGEVARELRTLLEKADPDVICLQGVNDWETCERICQLKPGFRVLTCSAFTSKSADSAAPQVAILSRDRAVITWVEELSEGSGFAFAVLQTGGKRLGVFSLEIPKAASAASLPSTDRVLAEMKKVQKFPQNRPDAFLIAGGALAKSSGIVEASLQNIPAEMQGSAVQNRSEFWVANAGFIARPRAVTIPGIRGPALVCDFDAGSSFSSKFAYQTPLLFAGETPASLQPAVPLPAASVLETRSLAWPVSIGVAVVILGVAFLFRGRRREPQMQLVPLNQPEGVVLSAHAQQDPIRMNLLSWLKSVFVQRLLSQRQQLLTDEAEATRRTLVIEEKLSTLQTTLQSRIAAYEARIERLELELTAAAVENRDLIRSQIDLLKEKVAKAKGEQVLRRN